MDTQKKELADKDESAKMKETISKVKLSMI